MAAKNMQPSRRALELKLLATQLSIEVNNTKKPSEIIDLVQEKVTKLMAFLVVETSDELEIARLWLSFEDEINRMRGIEKEPRQISLYYVKEPKENAKKQGRDNTK